MKERERERERREAAFGENGEACWEGEGINFYFLGRVCGDSKRIASFHVSIDQWERSMSAQCYRPSLFVGVYNVCLHLSSHLGKSWVPHHHHTTNCHLISKLISILIIVKSDFRNWMNEKKIGSAFFIVAMLRLAAFARGTTGGTFLQFAIGSAFFSPTCTTRFFLLLCDVVTTRIMLHCHC